MTSSTSPGLARLNDAAAPAAAQLLREVCGSTAWCAAVAAGRPYADLAGLLAASDAAMAALTAADLAEAMAAHPPIGRPAPGDPASAREQSGVGDAERAELLRLNAEYQQAHGHVFLIRAAGRTGAQMLAALKGRIGNDPDTEREIVRTELAGINRIRLTRLAGAAAEPETAQTPAAADAAATPDATTPTASVSTHILDTSRGRPAPGVDVTLSVRAGATAPWTVLGAGTTDADGRCADLPAPPEGTTHVRLDFAVEPYLARTRHATDPRTRPATDPRPHTATDTRTSPAEAQQDAPRTDSGPRDSGVFFPEVAVVFAVAAGEHFHVPLLLNPFGYSVYRGS
ncbi:2-oxo-4-hydroxy-4-carboxy-5-ureidoimidazoline decarboxylase [Actinacidiphila sp. DG2A-62]|uniref:2-oxo-4-hydroxy-4-carboxy-5-ureidoimidazoline decarboxylase n=1 Tax=Actinacidiphila sp. DG2A-62 TaxID=3108821 RepID=UPI002DB843D5|nr:2-oxo-4-hydroxy-4-carboxy-5-ureidoimidazoline decarboxylase [Actinacidiphila sp. DG2A-62]MEC3997834.1 2-oxo-4-hydroxy-4-carboxy-5-ureidoimidazoline decarboxylase [Actinacidiphila sp. DG2A-62]